MSSNLGQTRLKKRYRPGQAMREFDRLPPILRAWLVDAALPWRPGSVRRIYNRALVRLGDPQKALAELDRLQSVQLAKDAITTK